MLQDKEVLKCKMAAYGSSHRCMEKYTPDEPEHHAVFPVTASLVIGKL
jgi:hypothetical protein